MRIMRTPRTVDLDITNRCNLRCKYCFHFTSAGDVGIDLPKEEWLQFFEELNRCTVMEVCLTGGEPFYREDLKELIDGIIRNRMRFSILSNGTLITGDAAAYLASTGRCNSVQVSIDGSGTEPHDSCRGDGNFLKAMAGINNLKKHNVSVAVRITIHKHNVWNLEEVAEFLLDEIGLPGFSTNSASYFGLCAKNAAQVQLTVEERSIAMETLLRLNKKYNGRINGAAGPLAEGKSWGRMEKARLSKEDCLPGRGRLTACGCPMSKIAIRADGAIVPCNMLSHIKLGQINHENLQDVWLNHPEMKKLRIRRNIPLSDFEFCNGCEYINYCTGNCPALAHTMLGKVDHPSPDGCLRKFLDDGGKLPVSF
tara:strand:+ start:4623 stop:5723 length:1101 start_codon:yes stop_codon:yes gene_type:complete